MANENNEQYVEDEAFDKEQLDALLENNDIDQFREEFLRLHTYDQGEYFEICDDTFKQKIYQFLSPNEVADFFETTELDDEEYEEIFQNMNANYASEMLSDMSYDNAVDILNVLSRNKVATLLTLMNREDAREIKALLHYEEDTAGGIMTTEYISVYSTMSVKEAMFYVKEQAPQAETIYVIFVVDENKKLAGVISLRDLIVAENDAYIEEIMSERVLVLM